MKRWLLIFLSTTVLLALTACHSHKDSDQDDQRAGAPILEVTGGAVKGTIDDNGVASFKGIPYAAAPTGDNRFRDPQPIVAWKETLDAQSYGPISVQNVATPFSVWTAEYVDTGWAMENELMSEDSLSVNVWTTAKAGDKRPVIVYIHGGANTSGSGANEVYTGQEIAKKDVVYLTFNYRLGLYGFLSFIDGNGEVVSGNFAIKDQIAALKWVQENIAQFGGDPANVTIVGQSAGAFNVQTLIASPAATGLFQRAVAMSGNSYQTPRAVSPEKAQAEAATALAGLTAADLRQMSIQDLEVLRASYNPSAPVIDGTVVTQDLQTAYATGYFNHVDLIQGGVTGDIGLFGNFLNQIDDDNNPLTMLTYLSPSLYQTTAYSQLGSLAEAFLAAYPLEEGVDNAATTLQRAQIDALAVQDALALKAKKLTDPEHQNFQYMFTRTVPDKDPALQVAYGAFHTGDVSYWLNYFSGTSDRPFEGQDFALSGLMSDYLVNFAKTGNPNAEGLTPWNAVETDYSYLNLDGQTSMWTLTEAQVAFWQAYYARQ